MAIVSGPVALFARWAWRIWRASREDAAAEDEAEDKRRRRDDTARRKAELENRAITTAERDKLIERIDEHLADCKADNERLETKLDQLGERFSSVSNLAARAVAWIRYIEPHLAAAQVKYTPWRDGPPEPPAGVSP